MIMPIHRHPDPANLMSYAAGTLCEPLSAAIACHVAMCPDCAAEVRDLELIGGLLMQDLAVPTHGLSAAPHLPQMDDTGFPQRLHQRRVDVACDLLPPPLVRRYGLKLDTIPWRWLGPGVMYHRLPLSEGTTGDLRLLKIQGGRRMPEHGHGGSEMTVVIEGAYADETGTFRRGDIQDVDDDLEHQPVVLPGEACICLVASEHPARFKGLVSRLLQPVIGM